MLDVSNLNLEVWSQSPFPSAAQMTEAMRNVEYRNSNNDAYRAAVEAKVLLMGESNSRVRSTAYNTAQREITNTSPTDSEREARVAGNRAAEEALTNASGTAAVRPRNEREQRAADLKEAERLLAAQYGAGAIRPASQSVKINPDAGYGFQRRD